MTKLSINLNKIALLRNQREVGYPSVTEAAVTVIDSGAHGITVHPRPDQRHIRRTDVTELAALLAEHHPAIEFNIEGNPTEDFLALVASVRPAQVTLVPDAPEAHTSDHGWDIAAERDRLIEVIDRLHSHDSRVSVFVDAEPDIVAAAREVGADRVELYTGPYAMAFESPDHDTVLAKYLQAGETARDVGLELNAGHDLNLDNLTTFRRTMPWLAEVSIGHAFTADALWLGLKRATKAYLQALSI